VAWRQVDRFGQRCPEVSPVIPEDRTANGGYRGNRGGCNRRCPMASRHSAAAEDRIAPRLPDAFAEGCFATYHRPQADVQTTSRTASDRPSPPGYDQRPSMGPKNSWGSTQASRPVASKPDHSSAGPAVAAGPACHCERRYAGAGLTTRGSAEPAEPGCGLTLGDGQYHDLGADLDAVVEVDHVLVDHPDASGCRAAADG